MKPSLGQQLDTLARRLFPSAVTLFLVLLAAIPLHIPGFARVAPILALIGIYHWTLYRPDLMPARAVFLIGLLQDIVGGGPLGLYTTVFVIAYGITMSQARFFSGKGFVVLWAGFAAVALAATVLAWLIAAFMEGELFDVGAPLLQWILTVGIFPALSRLFLRWQPVLPTTV